jgi:hypothetical protein
MVLNELEKNRPQTFTGTVTEKGLQDKEDSFIRVSRETRNNKAQGHRLT